MNRRQFLLSSVAAGAAANAQRNQPVQRPNILVIVADDIGSWMLGCYGNKEIRTPNIDTLARGGLRFTNAFSASSVGAPSRASLFTGRAPAQHGVHDATVAAPLKTEAMISDALAAAGYNCGYAGKWDLGSDEQPGHGFKYSYTTRGDASPLGNPEMSLNGQAVKETGHLPDLITQRAGEFFDRYSATGAPFFLTVAYPQPHPLDPGLPQHYRDMYANTSFDTIGWERPAVAATAGKEMLADITSSLRRFAGYVTEIDDQIPSLLRKLRDLRLWDNTLILFTSDNGYLLGRHGLWSDGLASDPPNMYDEAVRVPFILSWPGKVPTAEMAPEVVGGYDVFPTLCEAAAIAPPANRNLPGRSFLAVAKRDPLPKNQPWRNLAFGQLSKMSMARDARYKLVLRNDGQGPNELYDTAADAREKTNRYEDPQFTSVRQRLTRDLDLWRKRAT